MSELILRLLNMPKTCGYLHFSKIRTTCLPDDFCYIELHREGIILYSHLSLLAAASLEHLICY